MDSKFQSLITSVTSSDAGKKALGLMEYTAATYEYLGIIEDMNLSPRIDKTSTQISDEIKAGVFTDIKPYEDAIKKQQELIKDASRLKINLLNLQKISFSIASEARDFNKEELQILEDSSVALTELGISVRNLSETNQEKIENERIVKMLSNSIKQLIGRKI